VHPGADQSLRVVRAFGIDTVDSVPRLYIAPADRARAAQLLAECGLAPGGRRVTINPFSRWKYKEWDDGKWRDVIDWLWEAHRLPSVLIGSPEEAAAAAGIIAGREGRAFSLAGRTTLTELAAVIATGTLHLGVDSAAPHIAAALGTPTVTIHGPTDWRAWRVADDRHKVVTPAKECVPCRRTGCDDTQLSACLQRLEVTQVLETIEELLRNLNR
jgi:heptosyltransferase-3